LLSRVCFVALKPARAWC